MRFNLSLTILNFLNKMIETCREEKTFLIPYGRVLSELLIRVAIVDHVKKDRDAVSLEKEVSEKFEFLE